MKKLLLISCCIFSTMIVCAQTSKIMDSLNTCTPYTETGNVNTEGMNVKVTKQIVGWKNDKCIYKETVNLMGVDATTTCRFTKSQIDEIVAVNNAYSLVQQYSNETVDTSSLDSVQNNPIVKVWNKYLQDGTTCVIETNLKENSN